MQKIAVARLGEVLLVDYMVPLGMTVNGLAEYLVAREFFITY